MLTDRNAVPLTSIFRPALASSCGSMGTDFSSLLNSPTTSIPIQHLNQRNVPGEPESTSRKKYGVSVSISLTMKYVQETDAASSRVSRAPRRRVVVPTCVVLQYGEIMKLLSLLSGLFTL